MVPFRRYAGHWRKGVAIGGLVLATGTTVALAQNTVPSEPPSPGSGQPQGNHKTTSDEKHSDGSHEAKIPPSPISVIQRQNPENQDAIASQPKDDGSWYARPDWWTAGFTGLLFIATSGLWIFTALLWRTTRRAVTDGEKAITAAVAAAEAANTHAGEAARSANAAESTTEIMRNTAEKQLRAYVYISEAKFERTISEKTEITIYTKNFGQTPAYKFKSKIGVAVAKYPWDFKVGEMNLIEYELMTGETVPPSGTLYNFIEHQFIKTEVADSIRSQDEALWVVGHHEYVDVFGKSRFNEFRLVSVGEIWKIGAFRTDSERSEPN